MPAGYVIIIKISHLHTLHAYQHLNYLIKGKVYSMKDYVFNLACIISDEECCDTFSGLICAQVLACLLTIGNIEKNPGPNSCCVRGCPNISGKGDVKRSFFSFPINDDVRNSWLAAMPQVQEEGWKPLKHHVICQDHFKGGWLMNELTNELMNE